jgi:ferritin-like metal-binding protein YciE
MTIENLRDLFEIGLRYTYDCEQQLVEKGIPGMIKGASSPELKTALEQHLEETRTHVSRLERIFSQLGVEADTEDNDVVEEMIDAAEGMISDIDASPVRDAALIVAGNQVEHYEIATYGSLIAFAQQLGLGEAVTVLQQTFQEEKAADAKLTQIAESAVNPRAAGEQKAA